MSTMSLIRRGALALGEPGEGHQPNLAVQMASRLGRDTVYYTVVGSIAFPIAFVNALVLTRYLKPAQYGQLAVLLFISGLTSVVLNLMLLRGIERQVWGAADEIVDIDDPHALSHEEKLRVLSSGIVLSAIACLLTIAAFVLAAPWLAQHLVHSKHLEAAVIWMGISGALGSIWRIVINTCRWERHRAGFGVGYTVRPVLAFALSWPLVAAGAGVAGAMAATAIATLASALVALVYIRHSVRPVLNLKAARNIARSSGNYAAMVVGLYVLHSGDTYFLSRLDRVADVGVYKLATNVASFISYAVSGFLMAWGPLERSSLFVASYHRFGQRKMRAAFMQYYMIGGILLVLGLVAVAQPVIALFAPSYHPAEKYIPITAIGYLAYGVILVVARGSTFPRRYVVYGIAALSGAAGLGITSALLAPKIGGYGVATGDIVGGIAATAVIVVIARIWGSTPSVNRWPMIALLLIGGGCFALSTWVAPHVGHFEAPLKVVSVLLFVGLMVATGAIPESDRGTILHILRASVRVRRGSRTLVTRTLELPRTDRRIVVAIARDRLPSSRVAALTGLPEATVRVRLVQALEQLVKVDTPSDQHEAIAEYLLDFDSVTAQDRVARELWEEKGVNAGALLDIESAFRALRSTPPKVWTAAEKHHDRGLSEGLEQIDPTSVRLLEEVVRRGQPCASVAPRLGIPAADVDRRLVRALRVLGGDGAAHPADPLIGAFLVGGPSTLPASQLWAAGVDPLELHGLELLLDRIRGVPERKWQRMARRPRGIPQQTTG